MTFIFTELTDNDFEQLVNDLISEDRWFHVESFATWKDDGIDGRFKDNEWKINIIQSKHYYKSGFSSLLSNIKETEKDWKKSWEVLKVRNLHEKWKLDKYIFATSVWLTPKNKDEIFHIFSPYIKGTSDILWKDDIDNLLNNHEKVLFKHTKLLIPNISLLQKVLNNDIYVRSKACLDKLSHKIKFFEKTSDFDRAIEKLEKSQVLIITWEPWIGKSFLSEVLCFEIIKKWYEFTVIYDDIWEADNVWEDNKKQIFYFDDFLWSNYLEIIEWKDKKIKDFIHRVERDKNKIFILNSRTTIFKSWIENSAISGFKQEAEKNQMVLQISDLTEWEKAKILYNHMYHTNVKQEYIDEIYENKNYRKIINHKNYNPRLIEFIFDENSYNPDIHEKFMDFVMYSLDNPSQIWHNVFEKQSNDFINFLVYLTVFQWWKIEENILKNRYSEYLKYKKEEFWWTNSFEKSIQIALKNFLVRGSEHNTVYYKVINPSISDYILFKFQENEDFLVDILYKLGTHEGLKSFYSFRTYSKKYFTSEIFEKVIQKLVKQWYANRDNNYFLQLLEYYIKIKNFDKKIVVTELQKYIDEYRSISLAMRENLLYLLSYFMYNLNLQSCNNIFARYLEEWNLSAYEFEYIWDIYQEISHSSENEQIDDSIKQIIEESYIEIIARCMDDEFNDIDIRKYYIEINDDEYIYMM